jgi:hypothetical protein
MRGRGGGPENRSREGWGSSPRRSVGGLSHADRTGRAPGGFARGKRPGALWTAPAGRRGRWKRRQVPVPLVLGPPDAGRTIPLAFVCDSEKTIHRVSTPAIWSIRGLFRQVKDLLGGQPLVFDREFSDPGLFEALEASGIRHGIRLNGAHRPTIPDEEGDGWRDSSGRVKRRSGVMSSIWAK